MRASLKVSTVFAWGQDREDAPTMPPRHAGCNKNRLKGESDHKPADMTDEAVTDIGVIGERER